jgi:hypothetical protein
MPEPELDDSSLFDKEGLKGAIDYTKTLLGLSAGAIAYLVPPLAANERPAFLTTVLALLSLIALVTCVLSGLFVISGASVLLSHRQYDLENKYVMIPGRINTFSFGAGFVLLSLYVAVRLFSPMPSLPT